MDRWKIPVVAGIALLLSLTVAMVFWFVGQNPDEVAGPSVA